MNNSDILALRLQNQLISHTPFHSPEDIVAWFGAVQAQDYSAAKWAIGLRSQNLDDARVEDAFNQGKILRTHVMRPTWHFVTPKDIQWLLLLTKNKVHKINSYYYRQLGLDVPLLEHCADSMRNALQGNTYLTREELGNRLKKTYRFTKEVNLIIGYILMYAELEGIICSGPRHGKQFTYALLEERIPKGELLDAEEALAVLTVRYFQSHGPATLQDFVWWSGLTTSDAKKGMELSKLNLNHEKIGEMQYWYISSEITKKDQSNIYLLPNFDEYIVGYTNRQFIFDGQHTTKLDTRGNPLFQHTIILDGKIIGTWKREFKKDSVMLTTNLFQALDETERKLLESTINQFGIFTTKQVKKTKE